MDVALQVGGGYDEALTAARWAESNGFAAFALPDHYVGGLGTDTAATEDAFDGLIQLAGINLSTTSGRNLMGIVVAHEVGHFLGLDHSTTNDNFMEASVNTANTDITHGQYRDMADHGFVGRFVP